MSSGPTLNTTTRFFRDHYLWRHFEPNLRAYKDRVQHIWSIGCSTGQEPCSAAILARNAGCRVEILATDILQSNIEHAMIGEYTDKALDAFNIDIIKHFERKGRGWRITGFPVTFRQMDITEYRHVGEPKYDFIFCRNVLMHLTEENVKVVMFNIIKALRTGGWLYVGKGEKYPTQYPQLLQMGYTMYQKKEPFYDKTDD
jgi:chemotaxis methyl-accepting protein methylase